VAWIGKLVFAGALASGVAGSQFPEFSQQYLQRLAGQRDVLAQVAAEFDASAQQAGLTRTAALADLAGTPFQDLHRSDMERVFVRLEQVTADLELLRAMQPLERIALPQRFRDVETLQAVWADYRPAIPVTEAGFAAAGIGFGAGWLALAGLMRFLAWPFRKQVRRMI
jgi:hypothetical protein